MKKILMSTWMALCLLLLGFGGAKVDAFTPEPLHRITDESSVDINTLDHFNNVVVFIRFNDEGNYNAPHNLGYYENLMNGLDTPSLKSYFDEVSYGQLDITSYFAVPSTEITYYVDSHDRAYYEPYDSQTNPDGYSTESQRTDREHRLLQSAVEFVDAMQLIDDSVDLDLNGDGAIDCLTFLVSGEDAGWSELLWPHKWSLSSFYDYTNDVFTDKAPSINGVYAYDYTFELLGNTSFYDYAINVSIITHETFHLISAPDLYHYYGYDWIEPTGYWGLMASLNDVPPHMLGYMKYQYGHWIHQVNEITESGTYTLYPLQDSPDNLYRINTGYSNEYVYLEYRDNAGMYESQLPESGLLVYRVDMDYYPDGNVYGDYSSESPRDEVFIFRPGISDLTVPITFQPEDDPMVDEDGYINQAALSDKNPYDAMGLDTDIPMFYSDGTLMSLKISNVVEHDGYITFDVFMPPALHLSSNLPNFNEEPDFLLDMGGASYQVDLSDLTHSEIVYYTTDGTYPDDTSTLYDGTPIAIDAEHNHIQLAVYINGERFATVEKVYLFTRSIETLHGNYGDNQDVTWYLHLPTARDMNLYFDALTEVEAGYDFITIDDGVTETSYTGTELADVTLTFNTDTLIIRFRSDESLDSFYGMRAWLTIGRDYSFALDGQGEVYSEIGEDYQDAGYLLFGSEIDGLYVDMHTDLDIFSLGSYHVTYDLYDSTNTCLASVDRIVHIIDTIAPTFDPIPDQTIEATSDFIDWTALVQNAYDNSQWYDVFVATDSVNYHQVGTYMVKLTITDRSNNRFSRTFNVTVQDTLAPEVTLRPSVDTIPVGETYLDQKVKVSDGTDTVTVVSGEVDTRVAGTYILTYTVTDSVGNQTVVTRYVTVFDQEQVPTISFSLRTAATTIQRYTTYEDGDCYIVINGVEHLCQVKENLVNTQIPGIYTVVYAYTYNDVEYTHTRYVFVVDGSKPIRQMVPVKREEGDLW